MDPILGAPPDAMSASAIPRALGARIARREDPRFLTGRGRYIDDLAPTGTLHAAFARSAEAHAELGAIRTERALDVPGVVAVLTAEDLDGECGPLRALNSTPGYQECDWPVLATGKVRMVGEPIALVLAEDRYVAEDGAGAVTVDYSPLPVLSSLDDALAEGAPAIHDEVPDNVFNRIETTTGDVDETFESADEIVELEVSQQRYGAAALEGRAVIASFDPATGGLEMWLATQAPHVMRTGIARCIGMPETLVRVISPDVGGGFGPKVVLYPEDVAVAVASKLQGRPVKWISDRVEDLQATIHGREQRHRVRAAATAEGRVTAVSVDIAASNGAYAPWPYSAALDSGQASEILTGPYDIPAYERRVRAVVTNKAPMGPYRGVGRVIACLTIERVMDQLASRLGLDPLEVRRRNIVSEFPHETATGLEFESGDFERMLDRLADAMEWSRVRSENEALRREGGFRGLGMALAVEQTAYGADALGKRNLELTLGYDTACVRIEPDGMVTVEVGLHNHGQGHETTIAQIASDELGVPVDDIEVAYGDTAIVPYGLGTWASRSTVACGGATILAARELHERVLELAGDMLEANPEDLLLQDGEISLRGTPSRRLAFAEVARRAYHEPHALPPGVDPGLESTRRFMPPDPGSFSSAAHAAHVEVDVETGGVRILRYVVVEDCGVVVNPTIVEGQVHGGVAQGIGGAMYEHLAYNERGTLLATSFMDYLLPGATEVPGIEVIHQESPSPKVPGGFKGMGEGGAINSPAAIVAAVNDALAPLGVVANHTPVSPDWIARAVARARERG